jgi:Xaa-Pro aminopeptidase
MLTMHSVLKHGGLYWDREVLPAEAYAQRFARIQAAVVESGDAGWFVYGDVARYGCVTYVTNFLPRVRSALAYVPAKGEPVLFANIGKRDVPAAKTITWVEDVRPFGRLPGEVVAFIEAEKLTRARIGHAGLEDAIPVVDWAAIDTGVPDVTWQSRDPELSVLRAVKEDWEVAAIARAAAIADDALALAPQLIRPGATIREIIAGIDRVARTAGVEDVRYLIASGPQVGVALRPIDDRVLAAGDTVLIYAAVEAQRYWAETARTFVIGSAPAALRALHAQAVEALDAMRETAGGGVSASDLAAVAGAILSSSPYGFGNAIGLDANEPPVIARDSDGAFADGATLALRAIVHENGMGVAVGQTVVLRSGHAEALNAVAPLVEIGS